ncbi:MAG: TerD family protein [Oscillospiraceae bacterium]
MAQNINEIIAQANAGGILNLPSGEIEGPVYINKPLRIVGNNTTIWAKRGSVIEINSAGVSIENLRVELTDGDISEKTIVTRFSANVKNVEVLGSVSGFGAEDRVFDIPRTLNLGEFSSDSKNYFTMSVNLPTAAVIECNATGLDFSPKQLNAGHNDITITVDSLSSQTFLYTEVLLRSAFIRRIYVTGRPVSAIPAVNGKAVFTAPDAPFDETQNVTAVQSAAILPPTDIVSVDAPAPLYDMPVLEMRKGQRVAIEQYIGRRCELSFSCVKPSGMEIDPYIFLLNENEKSLGDDGLVFFGNTQSGCGEVVYSADSGLVTIDFDKIDPRVKRITVAYSIYAGDARNNFSMVRAPKITISANGSERIVYEMDSLSNETTVVAAEIYLYKGDWRISAVGSGYKDGMAKLCNHYGIEVTG